MPSLLDLLAARKRPVALIVFGAIMLGAYVLGRPPSIATRRRRRWLRTHRGRRASPVQRMRQSRPTGCLRPFPRGAD